MSQNPTTKIPAMDDRTRTSPFQNLPNELIAETLTWLPVKTLLKFKQVCRSWRTLISSQQFVRSHLRNSKLRPSFATQRLLLQNGGTFKRISANSLFQPASEAFDLVSPSPPRSEGEVVVGSCNGLVCLSLKVYIGFGHSDIRSELLLWNPSTGIRKVLPNCGNLSITNCGFGYDESSDDYKVLVFYHVNVKSTQPEQMLRIYSLRNDEWKTVTNSVKREMEDPAAFVNGKLYWVGTHIYNPPQDQCLVCFDLATEEYEILKLPNCAATGDLQCVGEWKNGSLMVMCIHYDVASHLWIKTRRSVGNEGWFKVATFPQIYNVQLVMNVMDYPVLFLGGVTIRIAICGRTSLSYRSPKIRNSDYYRVCGAYIESLVSPLGGGDDDEGR